MAKKEKVVTQRNPGTINMHGTTQFPLGCGHFLEGVQGVYRLVFGSDSFLVVLYGAYNAHGLIGTEYNGIAVLWENRGQQALLHHLRGPSRQGQVSDSQRFEFARICQMDADKFRDLVNGHPCAQCKILVAKPDPIVKPHITCKEEDFLDTKSTSAKTKRQFMVGLVRFICYHCDRDRFTRKIYDGLHQHLGHIAHYNMAGFYAEWFADPAKRVEFLEHHSRGQVWGEWRDVDASLKKWINSVEGQVVLRHYMREATNATETAERKQLTALKAKYEGV